MLKCALLGYNKAVQANVLPASRVVIIMDAGKIKAPFILNYSQGVGWMILHGTIFVTVYLQLKYDRVLCVSYKKRQLSHFKCAYGIIHVYTERAYVSIFTRTITSFSEE